MTSRLRIVAALTALAVVLGGCGGAYKASPGRSRPFGPNSAVSREPAKMDFSGDAVTATAAAPPPAPGYGGGADGVPEPAPPPQAAPVPKVAQASGAGSMPPGTEKPHDSSYLVYTAQLSLAVAGVDSALGAVERMTREMHGYLVSRQDRTITVRVPRERFREALTRIEQMGTVQSRSIQVEDVTDQYLDTETRLRNLYAIRDRLERLRKDASVKDALELEKQIARIRGDIELLEGKLKMLQGKIAYSTITATFTPTQADSVATPRLPFGWLDDLGLPSLLSVHQ